jgi:hypothetical protein
MDSHLNSSNANRHDYCRCCVILAMLSYATFAIFGYTIIGGSPEFGLVNLT